MPLTPFLKPSIKEPNEKILEDIILNKDHNAFVFILVLRNKLKEDVFK